MKDSGATHSPKGPPAFSFALGGAESRVGERKAEGLERGLGFHRTGRRGADGRLSGAQAALVLREESVRRSERERRAALDQVATLERSLQAAESERRASQVGFRLLVSGHVGPGASQQSFFTCQVVDAGDSKTKIRLTLSLRSSWVMQWVERCASNQMWFQIQPQLIPSL